MNTVERTEAFLHLLRVLLVLRVGRVGLQQCSWMAIQCCNNKPGELHMGTPTTITDSL